LERLRSEMMELELETLAELKERVLSAMGQSFRPLLAQEERRAQERRKRKARKPPTPQPPESSNSPTRRITFDDLFSGSVSLWEDLDADEEWEGMFSPMKVDPLTMLNQYREYLDSVKKNFRGIFIGEADEKEWLRPRARWIEGFEQVTALSPDSG
jgi:hypothetical protein